MKRTLFFLLFINISCFGTNTFDNVVFWLSDIAKKPDVIIGFKESAFSISLWNTNDLQHLTNLVAGDQGFISTLLDSYIPNTNTNNCEFIDLEQEIDQQFSSAEAAETNLNNLSSSALLPILFQILEEGSFGTNEFYERYSDWDETSNGEVIGIYRQDKITKKPVKIYSLVGSCICDKLNVFTKSKDWFLTEIWVKYIPSGVINKCPPATCHFPYFWWYEGRKYATNIWSDFYRCWQYEQARATPREGVLDQLAKEIAELGICAIPIVKDAIDDGDNTLAPVLKALAVKLGEGGLTNQSFSSWYSENASKYILPPCEGLEAAKLRIADTNYVNELNGIINLGQTGHKTVRTYDGYANFMNAFRAEMAAYYTNRPAVPDYWYYKLADDVLEFDASVAYDLDRNCTNFNPRYLTPSN